MSEDTPINEAQPSENHDQKLRHENLSDAQLDALSDIWSEVKDSDTPVADLRGKMTDSGLFDFGDKYHTNNIELRALAAGAQGNLEHRKALARADELNAILSAVSGKESYADKRAALSDLLGFKSIYEMTNQEIDTLIADARNELHPPAPDEATLAQTANETGRASDGGVEDLNREPAEAASGVPDTNEPLGGDEIDQDRAAQRYDAHNHQDEAPAEGGESDTAELQPQPAAADAEPRDIRTTLAFVDESRDVLSNARDAAEARHRDEMQSGGRVRRFLRNMWRGENGIIGNLVFQRYRQEAIEHLQNENDVLALEGLSDEERERAQLATLERFTSEFDEAIHDGVDGAGEQRAELEGDSEFSTHMKDLLRRFAIGEITDPDALETEKDRILEMLDQNGNTELIGEGRVRIDNFLAVAEQVRSLIEHGESIERVLEGMTIYSGEARTNVRTEAHLGKIDRAVERLQESRIGSLVGPETIGTAAAVALGVARLGRSTVMHAAGVTAAPGVLGGAFAALRENKRVKVERALHSREMAQGKQYDQGARRDEMEQARYETASAIDLTEELNGLFESTDELTPEQVQQAYEAISMVEARVRLSDSRNIDLVAYSDVARIEQERFDLDVARARAKQQLAGRLSELPEGFRNALGIESDSDIDDALALHTDAVLELSADIDAKDRVFNKLRAKRVTTAAAVGFTTSFVFGVGAQEIAAFANPSYDGLAEHLVHPAGLSTDGRQTLLEGMVNGQSASSHIEYDMPSSTYTSYNLGSTHDALELPSDYELVTNADGTMDIHAPDGSTLVQGLETDPTGELTAHSLVLLHDSNVSVMDGGSYVSHTETTTATVGVNEYIASHQDQTVDVKRDFWYNNDTPGKYDRNELGLWWGGDAGKASNGGVQMTVAHMTENGSFQGSEQTNWAEDAQEGALKLAVSASRDTQGEVFMVDVQPDGTINIAPDDPAAQFFSVDGSGHMQFHGAYAEVVEIRSEADGVTHMAPLATLVGDQSTHEMTTTVTTETQEYVPHMKVTPPAIERVVDVPAREVEGFGVPGVVPRRSLERAERVPRREIYGGYGHPSLSTNSYESERERIALARDRSPRLESDPQARLDTAQELSWYREHLRSSVSDEYADEIEAAITSSQELQNLSSDTRAVVTIPVAAASESDNIYKTLSLYAQQGDAAGQATILLYVNWFDSAESDPQKSEKIHKTLAEIERARHDFPDLSIATVQKTWSEEKRQNNEYGRGMIGHVAQRMYDTAMMSVERAMRDGKMPNQEVLMIRNDADAQGMDAQYLERMVRLFDRHPEKDVFTGAVRWETARHPELPGLAFATNFREIMHVLSNRKQFNSWVPTIGINMAARMSTLAAVGGVGHSKTDTGAGSDDLKVGGRIEAGRASGRLVDSGFTSYYRYEAPTDGSDGVDSRTVSQYVPGANIDTKVDRLEAEYVAGRPITAAWGGFDEGGYRERGEGLAGRRINERGYLHRNATLSRVERNMTAMIKEWFHDRAQVAVGLSYLMPAQIDGGATYVIKETANGPEFSFTAAGRKWARKNITRDPDRVRRELYQKIGPVNLTGKPRFVQ